MSTSRRSRPLLSYVLGGLGVIGLPLCLWLFVLGIPVHRSIEPQKITAEIGFAYTVPVEGFNGAVFWVPYDEVGVRDPSELSVFENGTRLLPSHAPHGDIRERGKGSNSHWGQTVYFSTTDNSDPRTNGRSYSISAAFFLREPIFWPLAVSSVVLLLVSVLVSSPKTSPWALLSRFLTLRAVGAILVLLLPLSFVAHWRGVERSVVIAPEDILKGTGHSYTYSVPPLFGGRLARLFHAIDDGSGDGNRSPTRFYENDAESKAAHTQHTDIVTLGAGRFSHWHDYLLFSSLDNSDPKTNGRTYRAEFRYTLPLSVPVALGIALLIAMLVSCRRRGEARAAILSIGSLSVLVLFLVPLASGALLWVSFGAVAVIGVFLVALLLLLLFPKSSEMSQAFRVNGSLLFGAAFFCLALCELSLVGYDYLGKKGYPLPDLKNLFAFNTGPTRVDPRASIDWNTPMTPEQQESLAREEARVRTLVSQCASAALAAKKSRQGLLALPPEWQQRPTHVDGAANAFYWHNVLHVVDEHHFRRSTPFPPARENVFRIMVVGDSLTYGQGIPEEFTYPAVLEKLLGQKYNVEILNLGACGNQSEDVLAVVKSFAPTLKPDLIVYGMCLNDFLPSGVSEGEKPPFEIPKILLDRTRIGQLLDQAVKSLAIRFGFAKDFFGQVYDGIDRYHERFTRDVAVMNEFNRSLNLPPIVSLVLDQVPTVNGPGHGLTRRAEQSFKKAQFNLIESEPYYRVLNGENFRVSPWEGHPDEVLNDLFARMFADRIETVRGIEQFKK